MPGRQDDAAPGAAGGSSGRGYLLVLAALLALGAVAVVVVSANPLHLRLAALAGGCAFVLAAMVAVHRRREQVVAAGREADLRRSFELELEREEAAHREAELDLENELRREAEESMRAQLATLRAEVASLTELRQDVARMTALRDELATVAAFRDDLTALAALRRDVAALTAIRDDVGQLAGLRADLGRLRAELTEQLNGEMLVERIVMRTQATRMPSEQGPEAAPRTVEARAFGAHPAATSAWVQEPPRELAAADRPPVDPPLPPVPPRRRRTDGPVRPAVTDPAEAVTTQGPRVCAKHPSLPLWRDADPLRPAPPRPARPSPPGPEPAGHARLAEILAESGATPPPGGRRRRRYRDENEPDDVLARVLRGT